MNITGVSSAASDLGEPPYWDIDAGRLCWIGAWRTRAFGGPDLDILYVTSASRFLDEAERRAQPPAGHVFAIEGPGARGLPEPRFGA